MALRASETPTSFYGNTFSEILKLSPRRPPAMAGRIFTRKTARGEVKVKKIDKIEYAASSESDSGKYYRIMRIDGRWCRACKSFAHTSRACRHVAAMKATFFPAEPRPDPSRRRRARSRVAGRLAPRQAAGAPGRRERKPLCTSRQRRTCGASGGRAAGMHTAARPVCVTGPCAAAAGWPPPPAAGRRADPNSL